jgi:iron complex outermembrane receptor protein
MSLENLKYVLAASASIAALSAGGQALARTAARAIAPTSEQFEVAQANAARASADVGELVVTARRRAEAVQAVPLAVSVIGSERIDSTGAFTVGRLQQVAPALQFYSSNPRNSAVNIRGLGAPFGLTNDGIEQGVGIYVDDVYFSRAASSTFDFLDVARVEVLRGPQGTLYGKNTTAGAINVTTNAPSFAFGGSAEITAGSLGFKQAKASVSGPLTDTLAGRVSFSSTSRRGTIFNVKSGNWINELDNVGVRGQLLYQPNDAFDVTLAGDFSTQNPEGYAQIYVRTGATQRPLSRQYAALAAAQGYVVASTNPFDRVTDVDANLNAGNKTGGASARVRWNLGPGQLTSVTAWRFWDWKPENDRDFTGLPVVTKSQNPSQQDQYTQELRYSVTRDRYDYVIGAFLYKQRIDTQGTEQHGPASSRWTINPTNVLSNDPSVLNGLTAVNTQYLKNTSAALFGQLSWNFTDAFTLQPGVRLNYDKKTGLYQRRVYDGAGAEVLFGQAGAVRTAQRDVFAPQLVEPAFSDWNFSYDLTASYRIAPEVLAYGAYAKSFKSGGINQNGVPADAAGNPILAAGAVRPESVNHYEGGLKTQFWERRATLNLAVFQTDIKDFQANVNNGQFGVLRGYLANAGKVRTKGAEADFSIRPSQRFSAYVNAAYTDARYIEFVDAPCPPELSGGTTVAAGQTPSAPGTPGGLSPANCNISGQRLPGVSKWSFSFGAEANLPARLLGLPGQVYAGYDGNYRSDFSSNPSPSAYTWVDGYAVSNFRVGFRTDSGLDISGWVRNAFDEEYFEQLAVGPGNTGLIAGQPGDPRLWGVTLRARY